MVENMTKETASKLREVTARIHGHLSNLSDEAELEKLVEDVALIEKEAATFARKDLCHELGEFVDAVEYLRKDLEMARSANAQLRSPPYMTTEEALQISEKSTELKKLVEKVMSGVGCPVRRGPTSPESS